MRFPDRFCIFGLAFGLLLSGSALQCRATESLREVHDPGQISFDHDGSRLIVRRESGSIGMWEAPSGKAVATNLSPETVAEHWVVSGDSKRFVAGFKDGHSRVFDATTGKTLSPLLGLPIKPGLNMPALFSPDGGTLLIFSDKEVAVFNVSTGKRVVTIPLKQKGANIEESAGEDAFAAEPGSAAFAAGGAQCFIIDWHGDVRRYDTKAWKPIGKPMHHPETQHSWQFSFAVSEDAKWLATFDDPGENALKANLQLWDVAAQKPLGEPIVATNGLTARFLADNRVLVIPERGEDASVMELPSLKVAYTLGPPHDDVDGPKAKVSPDGKWLLVWGTDRRFDLFDAATGKLQGRHPGSGQIVEVHMASDSSGCYVVFDNASLVKLSFPELKITQSLPITRGGEFISFSPDGKLFAMPHGEGDQEHIVFFDAATLKPIE
jgi:WD40 repeat protein